MRLGRDRSPYRHGRIGLGKKKHRFHQSQKYKISGKKQKEKTGNSPFSNFNSYQNNSKLKGYSTLKYPHDISKNVTTPSFYIALSHCIIERTTKFSNLFRNNI